MEIKNNKDLLQHVLNTIDELKHHRIDFKTAVEMNNAVGKAINSQKLQLEYNIAKKKQADFKKIDFLEC